MNTRCWLFEGPLNDKGYGYSSDLVHRVVYEILVGPIPEGLELDHLCRVRNCYNPAHLEPVTHAENMRRSPIGNQYRHATECKHGHPFDEANTYVFVKADGREMRTCRACNNRRSKARHR